MLILRDSDAGFLNPKGGVVLTVQRALRDAGHSPGKIDGDFGGGTAQAVKAYQAAHGLTPTGEVDLVTWQKLTGRMGPPSIFERCLALTASFEGHGYTKVAGNFDGALITWGVIGFTMGGGNLQKVIKRTLALDPTAVDDAFGSLAGEFKSILGASKAKQKSWANSISVGTNKVKVKPEWSEAFHRLGQNPQCEKAQNETARSPYWTNAQKIVKEFKMGSELGASLAFDIAVQNGSVDPGDRKHLKRLLDQSGPVQGEAFRRIMAEAIALGSNPKWQEDVRSRKLTIATGRGKVHGANYMARDWGLEDRVVGEQADEAGTIASSPTPGWSSSSSAMVGAPAISIATGDDEADFNAFIKSLGLRFFKPHEFLVKGNSNSNPDSSAFQKNTNPPRELWENIAPTARVLDILRGRLDAPIRISSVYRSPAYNAAIGGAKKSQHVQFRAIDFVVQGNSTPADWASALRSMRDEGIFLGGIGTYNTFVHVDTRGFNADF